MYILYVKNNGFPGFLFPFTLKDGEARELEGQVKQLSRKMEVIRNVGDVWKWLVHRHIPHDSGNVDGENMRTCMRIVISKHEK